MGKQQHGDGMNRIERTFLLSRDHEELRLREHEKSLRKLILEEITVESNCLVRKALILTLAPYERQSTDFEAVPGSVLRE